MEEGTATRRCYCHSFNFHWIYSSVLAGPPGQVTTLVTGTPGTIRMVRHWNREAVDAASLQVLKSGSIMLWATWSSESGAPFQPKSSWAPVFLWFFKGPQNPADPFCAGSMCCSHLCPHRPLLFLLPPSPGAQFIPKFSFPGGKMHAEEVQMSTCFGRRGVLQAAWKMQS